MYKKYNYKAIKFPIGAKGTVWYDIPIGNGLPMLTSC